MRYYGAHVSIAGGLANAIADGEQIGANAIQFFVSPPMRWALKPVDPAQTLALAQAAKGSTIKKAVLHCIYLINLARMDKQLFHLSKVSIQRYLDFTVDLEKALKEVGASLDVLGVIFHPGSAKDTDQKGGIKRIQQGLNWILERSKGGTILLESSAGAGQVMGDTLEELAAMRSGVKHKKRIGYCLDTQHMWASGYNWVDDLDKVIKEIDDLLGLDKVKCFHINDSKTECNSHKDRHANLGQGKIGLEVIKKLVNHPKFKQLPFILETPAMGTIKGGKKEISKLKKLFKDS